MVILTKKIIHRGIFWIFILSLVLPIFSFPEPVQAAVTVWDGGGTDGTCGGVVGDGNKWSCAANWVGDVAPGASDVATFNATSTKDVSITVPVTPYGIDIQSGYTGTITDVGAGFTLGAAGASAGYSQADGIFMGGNDAITNYGNFNLSGGTFTSTSNALYVYQNFTITGGTFNHNNGTFRYRGLGDYVIDVMGALTLYHFNVWGQSSASGVGIASGDTITVLGIATFSDGEFNAGGGELELQGTIVTGTGFDGGLGVAHLTGAAVQAFTVYRFCGLDIDAPNTTITGNTAFEGDLTVTQGTYTAATDTDNVNYRNITLAGGTFISTTKTAWISDGFHYTSGTFTHSSGTIAFSGAAIAQVSGDSTFYNLRYRAEDDSRYLEFASGSVQTVLNQVQFDMWYPDYMENYPHAVVRSTVPGVAATITFPTKTYLTHVLMTDITNNSGTDVICSANCESGGGNSGVDFSNISRITVTDSTGNTTETGTTQTFTVVLENRPEATVTIDVSSSDLTEGTVLPATLTFTTADWDTEQTVTVTGVNDADDDGPIAYSIVLAAATSTDPNYSGENPRDISLTNLDDNFGSSSIDFDLSTGVVREDVKDSADVPIAFYEYYYYGHGILRQSDGGAMADVVNSKIRPGCVMRLDGRDYDVVQVTDEPTYGYTITIARGNLRPKIELDDELAVTAGVVESIMCSDFSSQGLGLSSSFSSVKSYETGIGNLTYDPTQNRLWAPRGTTSVSVIDIATEAISTVTSGNGAIDAEYDPSRDTMWVSNASVDSVTVFDAATGAYHFGTYAASTFTVGDAPSYITYDPVNDRIWVGHSGTGNSVVQLNAATGATIGTYAIGGDTYGIAYDSVHDVVWVSTKQSTEATLVKFTAATGAYADGTLVASSYSVSALDEISAIEYDATEDALWVLDPYYDDHGFLLKLRSADAVPIGAYPIGNSGYDLAVDSVNHRVWVTNYDEDTATIIDSSSGRLLGTVPISEWPKGIAIDNNYDAWVFDNANDQIYQTVFDGTPTENYYTLTSNDTSEVDTSTSGGISGTAVTEALDSQSIYYSVSFDDRNSYKVWGSWRTIASNKNSDHGGVEGNWYWRSNADVWTAAVPNSKEAAISSAVEAGANNQMTAAEMDALAESDWGSAGGFDAGTTDAVNLAATLYTDDPHNNPSVEKAVFTLTEGGGTPPTITDADAQDTNLDGTIDQITITFNDLSDVIDVNAGDGLPSLALTDGCTIPNGLFATNGSATLVLSGLTGCTAGSTSITPTITYTAVASCATAGAICDNALSAQMANAENEVADDAASPVLMTTTPASGAMGVSVATTVVWNFSEAMVTDWVSETEWTISPHGTLWSAVWSNGNKTATLTRSRDLTCNTHYTVLTTEAEVAAAAGQAGNTLFNTGGPQDGDWTFDTGSCGSSSSPRPALTYSIDITNPLSGEELTPETMYRIRWNTGGTGTTSAVNLSYSVDGGLTYLTIANNTANNGYYDWDIPTVSVDAAIMKIEGTDLVTILSTDSTDVVFATDEDASGTEEEAEGEEETATEGVSADEEDNGDATGSENVSVVGCDEIIQNMTDEEFGVIQNSKGLFIAPLNGQFGASPLTGETEALSQVRPGDLFRSYSFSTVYCLSEDYERRPYMDETSYFTGNRTFEHVKWVTDATLSQYPIETPMLPDPNVILGKFQSSDTVYRIEANADNYNRLTLRALDSEEVAIRSYGENWADYVIDLNSTLAPYFDYGAPILAQDLQDTTRFRKRTLLNEVSKDVIGENIALLSRFVTEAIDTLQAAFSRF
ncbi:MAG: Ig-like domain-containing protein [Patescibacteria group bacterium]|jgi:hypothetical protein